MARPKDAPVWNEDLVRALRAREEQCRRQGSQRQYGWRDGAIAIEAVRSDIYRFNTGRIIGLPKLKKLVDDECRAIIEGNKPIFPPGYIPTTVEERQLVAAGNPYDNDPYLKKIKARGGAYAILLAFHHSAHKTLGKEQICRAAQPFCDEQMKESYHDGRTFGAWKSKDTLVKHGLLTQNNTRQYGENGWRNNGAWTWTLNENGNQFIEALLKKFPQGAQRPNNFQDVASPAGMRGIGNAPHEMDGLFAAPNRHVGMMNRSPITSPARKGRRTALVDKDEQELRDWLVAAQPGEQRKFRVGKDRRKFIHDFCQDMEARTPGLRLRHESDGAGVNRALFITVMSKGNAVAPVASLHGSGFATLSSILADDAPSLDSEGRFESPTWKVKASPSKRSVPRYEGACRSLADGESPLKRPRISAKEAAANAALLRQAMNESKAEYTLSASLKSPSQRQLLFDVKDEVDLAGLPNEFPSAVSRKKGDFGRKPAASKKETIKGVASDPYDSDDSTLLRRTMNESKAEYERFSSLKPPTQRQLSFDGDDEVDSAGPPKRIFSAVLRKKEDLDRKPAAIKKANKQDVVYKLDESDDEDIPRVVKKATSATLKRNQAPIVIDLNHDLSEAKPSFNKKDADVRQHYEDDEEVIDLADSQEIFAPIQASNSASTHFGQGYKDDHNDEGDVEIIDLDDSQEMFVPVPFTSTSKESRFDQDRNNGIIVEPAEMTDEHASDDEIIDLADSQEIQVNVEDYKEDNQADTADVATSDDDIVDVTDSQRNVASMVNPYRAYAGVKDDADSAPNATTLTILVDDRERTKNAKPRDLRIELMRHMESGSLNAVWPSCLSPPAVEEKNLNYGDFAFVLAQRRLPLSIERKKVSDLVQRSVQGDHWKQLQRMRDNCRNAVVLIEGDTRIACRFPAHGGQDREEWNPAYHRIDDEESLFRFVGRAILSSPAVKFFQAKDIQATHRAVGALGLIAALSEREHPSQGLPVAIPSASVTQTILYDRLVKAGIPWELSRRIAEEVGSEKRLDSLYNECASEECKSALLCPMISSIQVPGSVSSKEDWSDAIYRCYYSTFNDPSKGRDKFDELKHLVENHAILLSVVHTEQDDDTIVDVALSTNQRPALPSRKVAIDLTDGLLECFEMPTEASFYTLAIKEQEEESNPVQRIVMQTSSGNLVSSRLFIHVVPAKVFVGMIQKSMALNGSNFVRAVKSTAERIDKDCKAHDLKQGLDRRVIIFQGMMAACDAAAKQPGFRAEVRVVIDLVMADLMYSHEVVVLQAVRQTTDLPLIVRQLALACLHYQLLTQEKVPVV